MNWPEHDPCRQSTLQGCWWNSGAHCVTPVLLSVSQTDRLVPATSSQSSPMHVTCVKKTWLCRTGSLTPPSGYLNVSETEGEYFVSRDSISCPDTVFSVQRQYLVSRDIFRVRDRGRAFRVQRQYLVSRDSISCLETIFVSRDSISCPETVFRVQRRYIVSWDTRHCICVSDRVHYVWSCSHLWGGGGGGKKRKKRQTERMKMGWGEQEKQKKKVGRKGRKTKTKERRRNYWANQTIDNQEGRWDWKKINRAP